MRVLVLSGTGDGRALVRSLTEAGHDVTESVAGRTKLAREMAGVRVGGFGGADGLVEWLGANAVDVVVDATHPFAATMTANAAAACAQSGVRLARWVRPSWRSRPDADAWTWVEGHDEACATVESVRTATEPGRVLLTIGRQNLDTYRRLDDVIARVTEPAPGWETPFGWEMLIARGPFTVEGEIALLRDLGVGIVVSKDSGGEATSAKLDAAAALGVRIVMVSRPPTPDDVPEFAGQDELLAWLRPR
ncbi:MAG: cobalt-precorrin-6A reductase [Dermatophilus congolensis]|nr:cobalt-precorrin-6A reductase [Dermatophilus congolensis]